MSSSEAFVTLAMNDGYALGALVLAKSIRKVGTNRNLVVLISNHVSDLIRKSLEQTFDKVLDVDQLKSNDNEQLQSLSHLELGITFKKINCWLLVQYSKCVFLDSDCLVLQSIDNLFDREEFSAVADADWPDFFNSSVFVYRPSKETFTELKGLASLPKFSGDCDDQRLLNCFVTDWHKKKFSQRLSFIYNVNINVFHSNRCLATRFQNEIRVIRFAGDVKPWQLTFNPENEHISGNLTIQSNLQRDFLVRWCRIMYQHFWHIIPGLNQQSGLNNQRINQQEQFEGLLNGTLNNGNLMENKRMESNLDEFDQGGNGSCLDQASFVNTEQELQWHIDEHYPSQP